VHFADLLHVTVALLLYRFDLPEEVLLVPLGLLRAPEVSLVYLQARRLLVQRQVLADLAVALLSHLREEAFLVLLY